MYKTEVMFVSKLHVIFLHHNWMENIQLSRSYRRKSLKIIRSQSISLQIPGSTDSSRVDGVLPLMSSSYMSSSGLETLPDFQRVTISGDYCAGVSTMKRRHVAAKFIL